MKNLNDYVRSKIKPKQSVVFALRVKSLAGKSRAKASQKMLIQQFGTAKTEKERAAIATEMQRLRKDNNPEHYQALLVEQIYGRLPTRIKSFEITTIPNNGANCGTSLSPGDILVYTMDPPDLRGNDQKLKLGRSSCDQNPKYTKDLGKQIKQLISNLRNQEQPTKLQQTDPVIMF